MAQPAQVFATSDPSGAYSVIDNAASLVAVTANTSGGVNLSNNWSPAFILSFDQTLAAGDATNGGALKQGSNTFTNGTIPAFLVSGTTSVVNSILSTRVVYKNPA